jgi:hypothetical protein
MANKYIGTRVFPLRLVIAVIAVLIVAVVVIMNLSLFSGLNTSNEQPFDGQQSLLDIADDRSVLMTVRGPIVADEEYRTYQIHITPSARTLAAYSGYNDNQLDLISLDNSVPAYEQFVYALNKAKYMSGSELTGDSNDLRGVCAAGRVYTFQILQGNTSLKQLWTSSCSSSRGSLSASFSQISKLFLAQIPDADKTIKKLW